MIVKRGLWEDLRILGAVAQLGERICEGLDFSCNVIDWVCQWGSEESNIRFDLESNIQFYLESNIQFDLESNIQFDFS
jgi:hypothetical protein